jgi:hypothetical protein
MLRAAVPLAAVVLLAPHTAPAQDTTALAAAEAAYRNLAYDSVLIAGRMALDTRLSRPDRVRAHELMAFAYTVLDSTERAVEAFRQVVYLDPDREYDPERVAPDFVQLHRIAQGRELVVRRLALDSAAVVAGTGAARLRFEVTRPAEYEIRVAGPGLDSIIARGSTSGSGTTIVAWPALRGGEPVPAGEYDLTVTVAQFEDRYTRPLRVLVRHGAVDTLPYLERIDGLEELPEMEAQRKNWIPLALTALAAGVVTGASFALESGQPSGTRTELLAFDLLALGSGIVLSLRQPPPRPVPAYIEYNRRVRVMLDERNRELAAQNAERRRQVVLIITPLPDTAP